MLLLQNKLIRRILIGLILFLGLAVMYYMNRENTLLLVLMGIASLVGLYQVIWEKSAIYILILLSFTSTYAFLVSLFQFNLPVWLVMIGIFIIFGSLFTYTEQKIGILGNRRLIYLILFSLIILEVFLALTYFLIDPISQSLIISSMCYLFIGFCYTVIAKHTDNKFSTYAVISSFTILAILLTSSWGTI